MNRAASSRIKIELGVQQYSIERDCNETRVKIFGSRIRVDKAVDMTNRVLKAETPETEVP